MQNTPRPTQRTIADLAKVTQATVSLALSNDPSVSQERRDQIQKIADEIGYTPDPYLSGLSAYRKRNRPAHFRGTLCWLSNYPYDTNWRIFPAFKAYFDGALDRAASLGYHLEEHKLTTPGMTPKRMESILRAKNIQGILVSPQPHAGGELDFSFKYFSSVVFGYSLVKPELHLVTQQQFRSMELVFRKLIGLGYKRPGLALHIDSDRRADRNWSAAFWSEQRQLPEEDRLPLLLEQRIPKDCLLKWIDENHPDVIITINPRIYNILLDAGYSIPKDIGFAHLTVPDDEMNFSGISENPEVIGAKAVEILIDLIHRNEVGVPDIQIAHLVAGTWVPGKTVRSVKKSTSPKKKAKARK